MKLTRLRVNELRQFRQPFELAGLQAGLNIFTGPNEAGKSTLVRALRAAFFERHRSTGVEDLRPYGDDAAAPQVELDFSIGDTDYRLSKSFLHKKRCSLLIGARPLEGVEAEDHLAGLLGYQFALKGASQAHHWGIPGLLWIEQGAAQEVKQAVGHAVTHLQGALNASLGEVAATGGDAVLAQVRELRAELLTATGKPRAAYQQAIERATELQEQVSALGVAVQTYRSDVDRLRLLRDAHATDAQQQPWQPLRAQQAEASKALDAIDGLSRQRDAERASLQRVSGLRELLLQQLAEHEQQQRALVARDAASAAALQQHEQHSAVEQQTRLAADAAETRLHAAREALALARQEHNRALLTRQFDDASTRAAEADALLQRAGSEHERAAALKRDALASAIDAKALKALQQQQQRLRELEIRQDAAATRIGFSFEPGAEVQLSGETLAGSGERRLVAPARLTIAGIGELSIAPGGTDLAELAREQAELRSLHATLLQRLGLASLAAAEAREQAHRQKSADAVAADKTLAVIAPKGLDALRGDFDAATARRDEARAALAQLPVAPPPPVPLLGDAERAHESLRTAAEASAAAWQSAKQALAAAATRRDAAQHERDLLHAALADPQRQLQWESRRHELIDANAQASALKAALDAIESRIAAARPDILQQDVQRLGRSADEAERQHQSRDRQIVQLETTLAAAGAQALEEGLATREGELMQALRRREALQRRAEALDCLLTTLESRRQALTRRLQAPLQKHLDRYLQLLFPSGRLDVDEQLAPGALTRPGPRGTQAGAFETLSYGAREQMGVVSRLAYADLLKEAGKPTLLILDDALVHSDAERLSQMKRVLFDAAQRHQVLVFTCHPQQWRDMGVALRELASQR